MDDVVVLVAVLLMLRLSLLQVNVVHFKKVPVERKGVLVGIISRGDVIRIPYKPCNKTWCLEYI